VKARTKTIELTEYQTLRIPQDGLSENDARILYSRYSDKIQIDPPSFINAFTWGLTSLGWVGYLPLTDYSGISLKPKTSLSNLFRMLEYAYDLKSFHLFAGLFDCETLREFFDRLAVLLAKKVLLRIRKGLYKTYVEEIDCVNRIRGRILFSEICRKPFVQTVPCCFEDQTIDNDDNRIIAWTLHRIARSGCCGDDALDTVRMAEKALRNAVSLKPFDSRDCFGRNYNRLNSDYEQIHLLCRFFLDNSGPTQDIGSTPMIPFVVNMARLFELFVERWMQDKIDKTLFRIGSQKSIYIDDKSEMKIVMDLVIYDAKSQTPLCVLDTKYKAHGAAITQDYSQVLTYAENIGCSEAVLVYPCELTSPLNIRMNRIRVRGLAFDTGKDLDTSGDRFLRVLLTAISSQKTDMAAETSGNRSKI
jgi:5-methylcytosine-specific restriction enzyme subunit McrC